MSKITSNTCTSIYNSNLLFTLEKTSKEVMFRSIYTICVNYEAKIEAGAETGLKIRLQQNTPAPGGSGSETLV